MSQNSDRPTVLLCILDGVGLAPPGHDNAVTEASTPVLDQLLTERPNSRLRTDGPFVGLPEGQMGNSEVGHMTIGSGRVIRQSLDQVLHDLETAEFSRHAGFQSFLSSATGARAVHLFGLLSDGGVHSHQDHIVGISRLLAEAGHTVFVHGMTDGRDTAPTSAVEQVQYFINQISSLNNVHLATLIGRYFGMDRDNRWDRMDRAWQLWTRGTGISCDDVLATLRAQYAAGVTDEFMPALNLLPNRTDHLLKSGDAAFSINFRADRARQLVQLLLQSDAEKLIDPALNLIAVGTLTEYKTEFASRTHIVYPNAEYVNLLGAVVADAGLRQLRISETEKYAHVTYYLNCGREKPFNNEERILIPSPKEVATYDLKPEMSLPEVTDTLISKIRERSFHFIVLNIANGDQVGHTGSREAAIKAMEHVDFALGKILTALEETGGEALVIADHGNVEELKVDGEISTAHSMNPVPCIYFGPRRITLDDGGLRDVAPTLLQLMGLPVPAEMTGQCLFKSPN